MDYSINHLFKPKRTLYYFPATQQDIDSIYLGILPEEFAQFNGAFGTYDCPGIFHLNLDNQKQTVIGIEFRSNDPSINYPQSLQKLELPANFMFAIELTSKEPLSDSIISNITESYEPSPTCKNFWPFIQKDTEPEVVEIFCLNEKNRIYISAKSSKESFAFMPETPKENTPDQLYRKAYLDFITGYYNWNHIKPYIEGFGLKGITDFSFIHFDIKDFKTINEVYGHNVANNLLTKITRYMASKDWIYQAARCDNDNFAMMIKDMPDSQTEQLLRELFNSVSQLDEDPGYKVHFRVGVVPMRNTLLLGDRSPDAAKMAQRLGTKLNETEIIFYTDKMHDEMFWAKTIKTYLDTAIKNNEFIVYLQPKYDIKTEKIIGAEALIRWDYQKKGLLPPVKFIPFLEREGSIGKVDHIVLHKVCQNLKTWKQIGLPLYPISVNLSRKTVSQQNIVEHLTSIVDTYNIDHSLIDFELTESTTSNDQSYMLQILSKLKEKGFKISMDDFGTGYSSLSLLTKMPLDTLKIDKSFVDGIGTEAETESNFTVIKHIISMAKELHFHCIAEGAEDATQIERLRSLGCESVQGYYYSKPLPIEKYEQRLKENI